MDYIIEDRSVVEMVVVWEIRQRPWCARSSSDFRRSDTRYLMTKLHPTCATTPEREREMISTQRRLHCLLSGCPHAFPKERRTPGKAQKSHACFMASPGHACLVQSHEKAAAAAGLASPSELHRRSGAGRPARPDMSTCMKSGSFT